MRNNRLLSFAFIGSAMLAIVGTGFGLWFHSVAEETPVASSSDNSQVSNKYAASVNSSSSSMTSSMSADIEKGDKLVFDQRDEQGQLTHEGSALGTLTLEVTVTFTDANALYNGNAVIPMDVTCDIGGEYDDAILSDYVNNPIDGGSEEIEVSLGESQDYTTSVSGNKLTVKKDYDFTWGYRRSEITNMDAYNKLLNTVKNGHVNFHVSVGSIYYAA